MTRTAARSLIGLAVLGLAFGAFGTWRAWQPGADGTNRETQAQRLMPGLELVAPAFAAGNAPPNAEAGFARTVAVGQTVVLDGSDSTEPEGKKVDFLWAFVSVPAGSAAALNDSTAVRPSFVADLAGDYVVELVVTEGPRDSAPDTVTISTTNSAPVAEAGRDQAIAVGQTVRLDGGASSDVDGDPLSYSWTLVARPAGSMAALDDPSAVQPGFIADVAGDYLAELSVSDGTLSSAPAAVSLSTDNVAPLADAGLDQRAVIGQRVELDAGRASDAEGNELAIGWSLIRRPQGSAAKLSTPAADRPSFLADVPGVYIVQLDAGDGQGESAPETSVITTGNTPPTSDAGPDQAIGAGQLVTLDGGGSSDLDGDALDYRWALIAAPAGSMAALDDPAAVRPEFTADLSGTYVAQLVVDDGTLPGRPDTVSLSTGNVAPVADVGPDQTVAAGGLAQLDGGGSFDADLDALTFEWSILVTPNGSMASLDDPNALNPNLALDKNGVYIVQLLVSDGQAESAPDGIVVSTSNSRPVAEAGADQQVVRGVVVQLDGSAASDPDNDPLAHRWALLSKPVGSAAALSDLAAVSPSFTADAIGTYVAQLVVGDGTLDSEPDTVVIETVNRPPVADAGPDQAVTAGDLVTLDGSASFDPDLDPITYSWSLVTQPAGSTATLSNPTAVNPTFVADVAGDYLAELIVNDGLAPSVPDQVTITAAPVANVAPVLAAIGDQSVDLGATLTLTLSATDLNGDPLSFSASALPLPPGASLDGITGEFIFTPDATQVGDIALAFIVSDGLATDSEAITITVVGAPPGGVTELSGRLLDANDADNGITTPIVGATVSLIGAGPSTTSDSNGDFLLSGVPSGDQVFDVDSTTAQLAPDGSDYASFHEEITLIADVTNVLERPVFLPRIDVTSVTMVDPAATIMVINATLGVMIEIPPNTAKDPLGQDFTGDISISEVPLEFAPMTLPEELQPALLVTIQSDPPGATFAQPVRITFPNLDNLPPGTLVDIYSLDPGTGSFKVVGIGEVSTDGTVIETTAGGVVDASWHFPLPRGTSVDASDNNPDILNPDLCVSCDTASITHVSTGNLSEDHALASYRSLNQARSLRFVYNSTSADPRPVIVTQATLLQALPNTVSTRLEVAGVDQGEELFTNTAALVPFANETIRLAVQFDAGDIPTGAYPYRLSTTSQFDGSSVSAAQADRVLVNNERGSPFGAGWTLDGLERLHPQADGNVILTRGDGSILRLRPSVAVSGGFGTPINSPASNSPFAFKFTVADFDGDGILDVAQPDNGFDVYFGDGQGGFPVVREFPCAGCDNSLRLETGDFNGDGVLDAVVSHLFTDMVTIHLGLGRGFFAPAIDVPIAAVDPFPSDLAVADFDLDGNDDFVVVANAIELFVMFGDGAAGFPSQQILMGDSFPTSIAAADVNGDSLPDILAREDTIPGQVSVYLNDPQNPGTFTRNAVVMPGTSNGFFPGIQGLRTADFDGDGNIDLAVKNTGGSGPDEGITILFGDGTGDFAVGPTLLIDAFINEIDVADFNGDGNPDLVCDFQAKMAPQPAGVIVLFGDGQGGFAAPVFTSISDTGSGSTVRTGDFDGDGAPDVLAGELVDDLFVVLLNEVTETANLLASPPSDFSTLVKNPDDSFTRTLKNGTAIEYDTAGFMTARVDRNGNATSYAYDGSGNLTTITDPVGLVTTLAYTGGLLTSVTDPAARVTGFAHDGAGDLVSITDPDLSQRLFAYDAQHRLTSQTSKRGFTSSYLYGFHGRNTRADRPDSSFVLTAPAEVVALIDPSMGFGTETNPALVTRPNEVVASFTDGNGNTTTFEVDRFGALTDRMDALSRTTANVRDADSLVTQTTSPNGRVDQMTYDARGNRLTLTEAVGDPLLERSSTFEYEPIFNQVTKITDPRDNPTTFDYDGNGNLIEVVDAALTQTTLAYGDVNCPGLVTSVTRAVTLAEETTTTFAYDPVTCNLVTTTDDLGNPTSFAHDTAGNVVSTTDALLRETRLEYDDLNRVTKSIDATNSDPTPACGLTGVTCFAYDAAGNLVDLTDANGNVTDFGYDERERVTDRTDPLLNAETFSYDGNGNLRFATDRKGQVIEFQYDVVDRLIKKIMQPGQPEEAVRDIGYDLADNVTSVVDPDSSVAFTYDLLNRVGTASTAGSPLQPAVTLTATYDANGNRLTLDDPVGQSVFIYDALNRLTDLATPSLPAQPILYGYDPLSRRTDISLPNGVDTALTFDTASRLTDISHVLGGVTTVSSFGYGHNAVNQRTNLAQTRPSVSVNAALTYGYDDLDRLTQATNPEVAAADETFGYDPVGNRLNRDGQVVDSIFDAANRLIEDQDFTYAYDLNGNLETKTAKVGGAVTDYTWDAEDRLVRIDLPGGGFAEYLYDGLDRRIQKDANGTVTRYVYDGVDILLEYDGTNFLLARTTHGPGIDDAVMLERDLDTSGTFDASERFFYQTDGLGSVTELTDSTGAVARTLVYDSYGQIAQDTGGVDQPFTYTGRELDAESGLYFYRARYYDPATGRFLAEDPIGFGGGDANLYRYVFNNPVNLIDPSGLESCQKDKGKKKDRCKNLKKAAKGAKGKIKLGLQAFLFACRIFTGQMDDALDGGAGPLDQKRMGRPPREQPPITGTIDPPPDPFEPLKKKGFEPVFPPEN